MIVNLLIHLMWNFPVMVFNNVGGKFAKFVAAREDDEARWLNG